MRAFIVGNGPSLNDTPLDKLAGEVSFATNRIRLIYPKTKWRPTHYVRAEEMAMPNPEIWKEDLTVHLEDKNCEVYCNLWFPKWLERIGYPLVKDSKLHLLNACAHYQHHYEDKESPHLWHFPKICTFGSSVNVAIQIAVQLGYGPLYLIGCDLGNMDHFDPTYQDGYEGQLREKRYALMDTIQAHMVAVRSSPVPIYNATIGGQLEVYPRVLLSEVL